MGLAPSLLRYAAGTTLGASVVLTPDSDKRIYLAHIFGFTDSVNPAIVEVSNALTGTVSTSLGSPTVTGTGTNFTNELEVGDTIRITDTSEVLVVLSITSNTVLTATTNSANNELSSAAVRLIAEFSTEVSKNFNEKIDKNLWGSYGKAVTVALSASVADCAITASAFNL
jgi:hypothetical protein